MAVRKHSDVDAAPEESPDAKRRRLERPVRRAATRWTLYQSDHAAEVADLPNFRERVRELARRFKEAPPEECAALDARVEEDRVRYRREMDAMSQDDRRMARAFRRRTAARRRRREGSRPRPKRPLTAYMLYSRATLPHVRERNPGISGVDALCEIGRGWKKLSKEEREPYQKLHEEDRERHHRELAEWRRAGEEARQQRAEPKARAALPPAPRDGAADQQQ